MRYQLDLLAAGNMRVPGPEQGVTLLEIFAQEECNVKNGW